MTDPFAQPADPIARFLTAWERVKATVPPGFDPAAMTLATVGGSGQPAARTVLLRALTARGFQFFTNYGSRKARELDETGRAALCFYWPWLDEQVRVEGTIERAGAEESDAYFATRPRGSQLGAWASRQSTPVASRADLEARYREVEQRFGANDVPRPPFWGGYTLVPAAVEFWRAGEYRLHDRMLYVRDGEEWIRRRLFP